MASAGAVVGPIFVDKRGVAAMLGISPAGVVRLVSSGRLPQPQRFGRLLRWPVRSIEALAEEG